MAEAHGKMKECIICGTPRLTCFDKSGSCWKFGNKNPRRKSLEMIRRCLKRERP